MKSIIIIIVIAVLAWMYFASGNNYYQGKPSEHFDGKRFFDPELNNEKNFFDLLKWQFNKKDGNWPDKVAVKKYDVPPKRVNGDKLRVSNIGHTTFLIQTQGLNILTDPIWSERASPVSFAGPKRVIDPGVKFEDLPPIDIVWISHNHYDHLDLATVERLWQEHRPRIITPLGNDSIIHSHNKEIKVEAVDWGDQLAVSPQLKLHIRPMQHWSARGLFDRNKALWAALVIESSGGNIYFVSDSGYGNGRYFKRDKQKFGDFRLAILPMGAYEPRWFMKYAHMNPAEMLLAHDDIGKPYTIPAHYGVFKLADESRDAPIQALEKAMTKRGESNNIKVLEVGNFFEVPSS